jgi:probable HAF family extracellular repeat protein
LNQSQTRVRGAISRRNLLAGAGVTILIRPSDLRAASKAAFTVTELPADLANLTGAYGRAINRKATVVGVATGDLGPAAVRSRGKTAWSLPPADLPSIANAINDTGLIAGAVNDQAAIWEDDEPRMLAPFKEDRTSAFGINAHGAAVGSADKGAKSGVALRWDGEAVLELPSLGGSNNRATGINDDGIIIGYASQDDAGDRVHAVRWVDGAVEDLGTLGGEIGQAMAINRHGRIVGSSTSEKGFSAVDHAFVWIDEDMTRLARLKSVTIRGRSGKIKLDRSVAVGLNDGGAICGFSVSASENDPVSVATLWLDDEVLDLNSAIGKANREVVLSSADGINRDRDVVCTGYLLDDPQTPRLFRLEPA